MFVNEDVNVPVAIGCARDGLFTNSHLNVVVSHLNSKKLLVAAFTPGILFAFIRIVHEYAANNPYLLGGAIPGIAHNLGLPSPP